QFCVFTWCSRASCKACPTSVECQVCKPPVPNPETELLRSRPKRTLLRNAECSSRLSRWFLRDAFFAVLIFRATASRSREAWFTSSFPSFYSGPLRPKYSSSLTFSIHFTAFPSSCCVISILSPSFFKKAVFPFSETSHSLQLFGISRAVDRDL